jgi:hypothetical protein
MSLTKKANEAAIERAKREIARILEPLTTGQRLKVFELLEDRWAELQKIRDFVTVCKHGRPYHGLNCEECKSERADPK